jgi:probable addiction module antidote protein
MEALKVRDWDPAEDMTSKESVIAYLEAAFEETDFSNSKDLDFFMAALRDIARSKGMATMAHELRPSFSPDDTPSFAAVVAIFNSLGFRLDLHKISA